MFSPYAYIFSFTVFLNMTILLCAESETEIRSYAAEVCHVFRSWSLSSDVLFFRDVREERGQCFVFEGLKT